VKHLSDTEVADWLASQRWLSLRDAAGLRFDLVETSGLTKYEATIEEDSASVGCDMAELFLHDVPRADFPGGLFWIARPVSASAPNWILVGQVLRAGGLTLRDRAPEFLLLESTDYEACVALVALTLMFGWDANLVLAGRRFLLTIDDEPFPALITDHASEWFIKAAENLDFKISRVGSPPAG
jgi:hypothetical protein